MNRIKRRDKLRFPTRSRPMHSISIENYNFFLFFFWWRIKKPLDEKTKRRQMAKQKLQAMRTLNGSNWNRNLKSKTMRQFHAIFMGKLSSCVSTSFEYPTNVCVCYTTFGFQTASGMGHSTRVVHECQCV